MNADHRLEEVTQLMDQLVAEGKAEKSTNEAGETSYHMLDAMAGMTVMQELERILAVKPPPEEKRKSAVLRPYRDNDEKLKLGRALLDKHGLHDWEIRVQNLGSGFTILRYGRKVCGSRGLADAERKLILIDIAVGRDFRQVVLHEIAHALQGKPGARSSEEAHDWEWIEIAWKIGCTKGNVDSYAINLAAGGLPPKEPSAEKFEEAMARLDDICARWPRRTLSLR
jgi:hypothetical protein